MTERGIELLAQAIDKAVKDDKDKDEDFYKFENKPRPDQLGG